MIANLIILAEATAFKTKNKLCSYKAYLLSFFPFLLLLANRIMLVRKLGNF